MERTSITAGQLASGAPQVSSALAVLRHVTERAHAQVEHRSPLLQPGFTREGYRTYLMQTAPFVAAAEDFACQAQTLPYAPAYAWAQIRRLPALLADMQQCGCTSFTTQAAVWANPRTLACRAALQAHGEGCASLGVLYVLEGSTLGGQVLAKHLQKSLQLQPAQMNYLVGPGRGIKARWNLTRSFLEQMLDSPEKRQIAAAAATEAFELFGAIATGV